ncbi:hypothetical protein OG21DRAFT_1507470 [Imleria badia]|nr:hypothetical protein OG21DRAFT_1507470 [Imleria badia]
MVPAPFPFHQAIDDPDLGGRSCTPRGRGNPLEHEADQAQIHALAPLHCSLLPGVPLGSRKPRPKLPTSPSRAPYGCAPSSTGETVAPSQLKAHVNGLLGDVTFNITSLCMPVE